MIEDSVVANIFGASAPRGFLSIVGYSHFEISRASKYGKCRKRTIALKIGLSKYPKPDGFGRDKVSVHLDTAYRTTHKPQAALIVLSLTIGNLLLGTGY